MSDRFDYIVVGAGSAGCALANRLSSDKNKTVLLLEAGKSNHPLARIPVSFALLIDHPTANWRYRSHPDKKTSNRNIPIPRGKLVGGSSAINGLVYVRGQSLDYDIWAQMGNKGWSSEEVFPFFKKLENYVNPCEDLRGKKGLVNISQVTDRNPIYEAMFKAGDKLKIPFNEDYNSGDQEGFAYTQTTIFKGKRISAKVAYIDPIKNRSNLKILTESLATKIIFEQKKAIGIEILRKGKIEKYFCNNEIILSGGAINSPQILELSGVGRPEILKKNNIEVIHELEGVGENLMDHLGPRLVYKIKKPGLSYNEKARGFGLIKQALNYAFNQDGFLNLPSAPVLGFFKTRPELASPDIQVHFIPYRVVLDNGKRTLGKDPGITCTVNQNRPESRGYIHIKSNNPQEHPEISCNFLDNPLDRDTLVDGVKLIRKIMGSNEVQNYCGEELQPGDNFSSDKDILQFIRDKAETLYHPSGTCKMGQDKSAVVDEKLKVRGLKNLRVADASIMPTLISGNTNGPCMMIGERCADFIMNGN